MRTAPNHIKPRELAGAIFGFCAGFLILLSAAQAADMAAVPPLPPSQTSAAAAMPLVVAPSAPTIPLPPQAQIVPSPDAALKTSLPLPSDPALDREERGGKGLANAEDKVTDSVKSVVKHFNTTENVTLDDLNTARQAVAKIDALIDIEKRLGELEKLRNEREGKSFSPAIPASALMPSMPAQMPNSMAAQPVSFQPAMLGVGTEVSRIIGSAGHYTAIVKSSDGQTRTVEVGDRVGASKVLAITSAGVELEQNGTKRLIPVKNIETVFGHSP